MSKATAKSRTEINRENAAQSTGPRTEAGKQRSSRNALNHGLTSAAVVLPFENIEDYNALKTAFDEQHQPGSALEVELLGRMVDCWWRLQRAYRIEAQLLAQREEALASQAGGGDAALAQLFTNPEEMSRMRLFMRYLGAAERAWNRASADFERAKKERLASETEEAEEARSTLLRTMEAYLNAPIPGESDFSMASFRTALSDDGDASSAARSEGCSGRMSDPATRAATQRMALTDSPADERSTAISA